MSADAIVARNRKARYEYDILETFEAGIVLRGAEVKSVRDGGVSLVDGYATIDHGEVYLHAVHIRPYDPANRWNVDPRRRRKLLMHKHEIRGLIGRVAEKGLTLIPLDVHLSGGYAKVTLGLARGRHTHDKREAIKRREMDRETARELGRR